MKETRGRVCKKVVVARRRIVIWCKKAFIVGLFYRNELDSERFVKIGVRVIRIVFTTIQI